MANGKPGRRKSIEPSLRLQLNISVQKPITDPRVEKAVAWVQQQNVDRRAAPMAWQLLVAALNGELGGGVQWAMESANEDELQKQMDAARQAMANFVVDDVDDF